MKYVVEIRAVKFCFIRVEAADEDEAEKKAREAYATVPEENWEWEEGNPIEVQVVHLYPHPGRTNKIQ